MDKSRPILVIGGTRGTGLLITQLLNREGCGVRVFARNPNRARSFLDKSVELVEGDLTKPDTLPSALAEVADIVFTAGCRSGYPVRERRVMAVEYEGVLNTLAAARQLKFAGRFLYMNSSGLTTPSVFATCLNLWKGNTLVWRRRVEEQIRAGGLDYTIIRTGVLLNQAGGQHLIKVTQQPLPLSLRYRIARADVAQVFLAALEHPKARLATFEAVWGRRGQPQEWSGLLDGLQPDAVSQLAPLSTAVAELSPGQIEPP